MLLIFYNGLIFHQRLQWNPFDGSHIRFFSYLTLWLAHQLEIRWNSTASLFSVILCKGPTAQSCNISRGVRVWAFVCSLHVKRSPCERQSLWDQNTGLWISWVQTQGCILNASRIMDEESLKKLDEEQRWLKENSWKELEKNQKGREVKWGKKWRWKQWSKRYRKFEQISLGFAEDQQSLWTLC